MTNLDPGHIEKRRIMADMKVRAANPFKDQNRKVIQKYMGVIK